MSVELPTNGSTFPASERTGVANSADPLDHSIRQKDTELVIVVGFFHDFPFDRARPLKAILRVFAPVEQGCRDFSSGKPFLYTLSMSEQAELFVWFSGCNGRCTDGM
jgi:hypothetical protein